MLLGGQEEAQRAVSQPSHSSNSLYLPSNDNINYDDGQSQTIKILSNDESKKKPEDLTLLVRLKVRLIYSFYVLYHQKYTKIIHWDMIYIFF